MDRNNKTNSNSDRKFIVIGGGPAGLTAAYELTKKNIHPIVFEKYDKVGGISRTENYNGFYFDMGGHRFFTKSKRVNEFWHEVMGDEFLLRPRLSRIYYTQKFFNYPIKPFNAMKGLGLWQSILIGLSYVRWQIFPDKNEDSFEQWVTNRFGKRLFNTFFKSYTEKVWGISTTELSGEWAAQRIKDLDLKSTLLNMFVKNNNKITTLIEEFHYPKRGPGMLWNKVRHRINESGGKVHLNSNVCGIQREDNKIVSVMVSRNGVEETIAGSDFISSMPVTEFIKKLSPPPPQEVLAAAKELKYRDFLTVCLIVDKAYLFEDNWIYIHDPDVHVGRIQNFKNWSPHMVPDDSKTSLGLEYFCNEGDELWNSSDQDLIELGKKELEQIGLANYVDVIDGSVFRVEKSYPVYDSTYKDHLAVVRAYIESLENFQTIGRNGLHRYNNQDHAMLTGMLAVQNALNGEKNDLWIVNAEQEYHEEIRETKEEKISHFIEDAFSQAFPKLDPLAFGVSLGTLGGILFFAITIFFAINDSSPITLYLWLLNEYLPGYIPTFGGSSLGLIYGALIGLIAGSTIAFLRNTIIRVYVSILRRRAEILSLEDPDFSK